MAVNDILSGTIVSQFQDQTINNTVYAQVLTEADEMEALQDFSGMLLFQWVMILKGAVSDTVTFSNIITRRLKPANTDVYVQDLNTNGDLPSPPLPSTCYALVRYYCNPYEMGQSNHWKIGGLVNTAQNRGCTSDELQTQIAPFMASMAGSPYTAGNSEFNLVRPPKSSDVYGQPVPRIDKPSLDGTLRNLRGRQVYL